MDTARPQTPRIHFARIQRNPLIKRGLHIVTHVAESLADCNTVALRPALGRNGRIVPPQGETLSIRNLWNRLTRQARTASPTQAPHEFLLEGDFAKALEAAESAITAKRRNDLGPLVKTVALVKLGKFSSALHFADKAWSPRRRGSAELAYVAACAAAEVGMIPEASTWLLRAVDHDPLLLKKAQANPVFRSVFLGKPRNGSTRVVQPIGYG